MAKLNITAKDGKVLNIDVPEGTQPDQYDSIVDDVMSDYESKAAPKESGLDKTARYIKKVGGMLSKPLEPIGEAMALPGQASEWASNKLAEAGHPYLGMAAAAPAIMSEAATKPFEWMNQAGEAVAEKGGEMGYPIAGAAAGTVLSELPNWVMGAEGIAKRAMLGNLATRGLKTAGAPFRAAAELATGPSVEEATMLAKNKAAAYVPKAPSVEAAGTKGALEAEDALNNLRQELVDIKGQVAPGIGPMETKAAQYTEANLAKARVPVTQAEKRLLDLEGNAKAHAADLEKQLAMAKQGLEDVENAQGMRFKSNPRFEDMVANRKRMAQLSSRLEKLTPDAAEKLPAGKLQAYRKLAQEASKKGTLTTIGNQQLERGREVAARALEKKIPEFSEKRSIYHTVKNAGPDFEAKTEMQRDAIKRNLRQVKEELKKQREDAKETIRQARSSEKQGVTQERNEAAGNVQKKILDAQQQMREAKVKAQELINQVKEADHAELGRIAGEGEKLVSKAVRRSRIIKAAGTAALTAAGLGGFKSLMH